MNPVATAVGIPIFSDDDMAAFSQAGAVVHLEELAVHCLDQERSDRRSSLRDFELADGYLIIHCSGQLQGLVQVDPGSNP